MIKKPGFTGINEDFKITSNSTGAENINCAKAFYPVICYRPNWYHTPSRSFVTRATKTAFVKDEHYVKTIIFQLVISTLFNGNDQSLGKLTPILLVWPPSASQCSAVPHTKYGYRKAANRQEPGTATEMARSFSRAAIPSLSIYWLLFRQNTPRHQQPLRTTQIY